MYNLINYDRNQEWSPTNDVFRLNRMYVSVCLPLKDKAEFQNCAGSLMNKAKNKGKKKNKQKAGLHDALPLQTVIFHWDVKFLS